MAKPKKAKLLVPKTAKQCNVSEELTSDVVDFFYSKLRGKLEAMKDPIIKVPILGNMVMNKGKIVSSIQTLTGKVEAEDAKNFKSAKKYQSYKTKLDQQIIALANINKLENDRSKRKKDLGKS